MEQKHTAKRLLRRPAVLERVAFSNTELHRKLAAGTFPKPIKIGVRAVAWPESVIDEYIDSLVQGVSK